MNSDSDEPLSNRYSRSMSDNDEDEDELPLAQRRMPKRQQVSPAHSDDSDLPISRLNTSNGKRSRSNHTPNGHQRDTTTGNHRKRQRTSASSASIPNGKMSGVKREPKSQPKTEPVLGHRHTAVNAEPGTHRVPNGNGMSQDAPDRSNGASNGGYRWWDEKNMGGNKLKWSTLVHNGVVFPPEYVPHNKPLIYKESTISLGPAAEEIATFYAEKLGTDYVKRPKFNANFFEDFRASMKGTPAYAIVKKLEHCDFSLIHQHVEEYRRAKKAMSQEEKQAKKKLEEELASKYLYAYVDGRKEKLGSYKIEPPGLFMGRGDHPKQGKVKKRIYPEEVTINIGEDAAIPECPMPGHHWGAIVHKHDVTWVCYWKERVTNQAKYLWFAAGSTFKGMSDHAKFEKARKLHKYIDNIRRDYRNDWKAKSKEVRQRAVAMYLIDKLALRVGNEKGDDEADTVGCCSLRVEHIKFHPPSTIELNFLGKDSIEYRNTVEIERLAFEALKLFCRGKRPGDEVFHRLSVQGLNDYLKSSMDGLSAKVFRTYNASITLDRLLQETPSDMTPDELVVYFNKQNKEVAILCNHQRSLPKTHEAQMQKMDKKKNEIIEWLEELKRGKSALKRLKAGSSVELTKMRPEKPQFTEDMTREQRAEERKRANEAPRISTSVKRNLTQLETEIIKVEARLSKTESTMIMKDDLKTVALGTSKINYIDPRIVVAWCKKHDIQIEKIFPKTLQVKFAWAMETSEDFRFYEGMVS
ncbi:DNA topoisomerase 1 [Gracilariopsis chorda]|uniref:DNA topoisomerase I n=1 Tax=Gracilariopsis chorda TaxID=448386 RepID=A0A2V3J781_9FLOR|nr:DNA topoisomerase 1 [Gracilariopsis chorda]|eukprot:PXF50133.1 DNA topoisomerase 1 [Gracilariopsis chorda]